MIAKKLSGAMKQEPVRGHALLGCRVVCICKLRSMLTFAPGGILCVIEGLDHNINNVSNATFSGGARGGNGGNGGGCLCL